MEMSIKEMPTDVYCPYCKVFGDEMLRTSGKGMCEDCPLLITPKHIYKKSVYNISRYCCNQYWRKMNQSQTWGDALENMKSVRQYINVFGGEVKHND